VKLGGVGNEGLSVEGTGKEEREDGAGKDELDEGAGNDGGELRITGVRLLDGELKVEGSDKEV
jgi:hypothetical protein